MFFLKVFFVVLMFFGQFSLLMNFAVLGEFFKLCFAHFCQKPPRKILKTPNLFFSKTPN